MRVGEDERLVVVIQSRLDSLYLMFNRGYPMSTGLLSEYTSAIRPMCITTLNTVLDRCARDMDRMPTIHDITRIYNDIIKKEEESVKMLSLEEIRASDNNKVIDYNSAAIAAMYLHYTLNWTEEQLGKDSLYHTFSALYPNEEYSFEALKSKYRKEFVIHSVSTANKKHSEQATTVSI